MTAINKVIAGDFEGKVVVQSLGNLTISSMLKFYAVISKDTVEHYELLNGLESKELTPEGRKLVGAFVLGATGPVVAQALASKGNFLIAIHFKDGKKSLITVDEQMYSMLKTQLD